MKTFVALIGALTTGCFADDYDSQPGGGGGGGGEEGGGGGGGGGGEQPGPCGELDCSPKTPNGLRFTDAPFVNSGFPDGGLFGPAARLAIGGTDEVALAFPGGDNFTFAFEAGSDSSSLEITGVEGTQIALRGHGGTAHLRIVDPATGELYDRKEYVSAPFARAVAVSAEEWITSPDLFASASAYVFAPGARHIGIAYLDNSAAAKRLIDTGATIELAGATQTGFDTLDFAATVGIHTATIRVGDADATVDIEVVAGPDEVQPLLAISTLACFGGFAHGAFVSGLAWTFQIDGQPVTPDAVFGTNCVTNATGPFTVTATSGGKSVTFTTPQPQ